MLAVAGGHAPATLTVHARFADLLAAVEAAGVGWLGVDMPIGLPTWEAPVRAFDREARRRLGRNAARVFLPPCAEALKAADHATANRVHRAVTGQGLSLQAWHLGPKIREVATALQAATLPPELTVAEAHPELAFAALNGGAPLAPSKHTREGRALREALLAPCVPNGRNLLGARLPGTQADDRLDALALAIAAQRGDPATHAQIVVADGQCLFASPGPFAD